MNSTKDLALEKVVNYLNGEVTADGFLAAVEELKTAQKLVAETGKKAVGEILKQAFERIPELQAITWTQYTPYFNDGDVCVFGLTEIQYSFDKSVYDLFEPIGGVSYDHDERKFLSRWSLVSGYFWEQNGLEVPEKLKELSSSLQGLQETLESVEDVLKDAFGDGVEVTVSRDGTLEIVEYDHD